MNRKGYILDCASPPENHGLFQVRLFPRNFGVDPENVQAAIDLFLHLFEIHLLLCRDWEDHQFILETALEHPKPFHRIPEISLIPEQKRLFKNPSFLDGMGRISISYPYLHPVQLFKKDLHLEDRIIRQVQDDENSI